jgi:hypothetical protein
MFVIEYDPINNRQMSPVWELFMNSGEMERIFGIRVKLQVIPSPGKKDPNSITKHCRYCKHHVNYSSKVRYFQHKSVINLDHTVTLAMVDGTPPPRSVSTLRHEYFDLEASKGGHIIHGVFVRMESAIPGPSIDITHMVSNKEAKEILTKIAHCPSAWWYWHWVEKGYTQGTIASLLNSFESEAADNTHDSTYDPQEMTVISMFAGDDENQWLDQVEEEFGSNLSEIDDNKATGAKTTIEIGINAKAALEKEMKEKDYDIEGVDLRSSKRTHQTNMTGKTGCILTRSVTTKIFFMNFTQQKTDLNAERKKNAQLEQRLREMEAALAAGYIREPPPTIKPTYPNANKTVSMAAPPSIQETNLATPTIINTDLPPTPGDHSANESSHTTDEVGRWD